MSTLATLAAAAIHSAASGVFLVGAGGALPDATTSNSIAGSGLFGSNTAGSGVTGTITGVKIVNLTNLAHTWVGDLQVTVIHVNSGTRVDLFSRFGVVSATTFGSSKDLNGNYNFTDGIGSPAWNPIAGAGNYASGTYQRGPANLTAGVVQVSADGVTNGANTNGYGSFVGLDASSAWRLEIRDFGVTDIGTLGEWSIEFNFIPTPGALALLGVAGFAGRRRRA